MACSYNNYSLDFIGEGRVKDASDGEARACRESGWLRSGEAAFDWGFGGDAGIVKD